MRIAYVCQWNPFYDDGVVQKIGAQVAEWRNRSVDVEVFCVSSTGREDDGRTARLEGRRFLYHRPFLGRAAATRELGRAVRRYGPHLVYLRYSLLLPPPIGLARRIPTVVEINSNDRSEYKLKGRHITVYNELNRRLLLREAAGFVFVTRELAASPDFTTFDKAARVISNGVDLQSASPLDAPQNARPRLVFLAGSPSPWHGLDKLFWLARALPGYDIDVVGLDDPLADVPPNVHVHPLLSREEYEPILAGADVAVGTLALHRKGMREAAPLKVREYLLHGLPVIIGYEDSDLDERDWFVLRLPNEESNVHDNVEAIRRFVARVAGRRVARETIAARIGLEFKEADRLRFFEDVLSSRGQESMLS